MISKQLNHIKNNVGLIKLIYSLLRYKGKIINQYAIFISSYFHHARHYVDKIPRYK